MDEQESTGITQDGQAAFATEPQTTTAPDSSPETKQPETTPAAPEDKPQSEPNVPWHQDPRWKEWQTKSKDYDTLKQQVDELLPLKDLASKFNQNEAPQIPTWFARIYGDDAKAWDEYNTWNKSQRDEIKSEVIKEYESKQQKQQEAVANANKHFEDSVAEIEGSLNGEKVDKNKLLKFAVDNDLVDSKGRWNYSSAFKFMKQFEKAARDEAQNPVTEAKKDIADKSVASGKEKKARNYMTPSDFKGKGWANIK